MQNSKIQIKILSLVFVAVGFLPIDVMAARLYFEPKSISAGVGSIIPAKVFLDSSTEKINALQVSVKYPGKILKLKDWSDGNSIINLWIQNPKAENDTISFQGIIPGGYQGSAGLLLTLNFEVVGEGVATTYFADNSEALLNDGKGTSVKLELDKLNLSIGGKDKTEILDSNDNTPPEDFLPVISRDINLFDNKYFLVFATQDKGSGIDHYEVSEDVGFLQPKPSNWITAESPVVL